MTTEVTLTDYEIHSLNGEVRFVRGQKFEIDPKGGLTVLGPDGQTKAAFASGVWWYVGPRITF